MPIDNARFICYTIYRKEVKTMIIRKSLNQMEYGDIFVATNGTHFIYVCKHNDEYIVYNTSKKEFHRWFGIEYKYPIVGKKED